MTRRLVSQRPVERHVRKDVPGKGRYHDKSVGWYLRNTEKRWIKGTHVVDTELVRVTKWTSGHEEVLPLKPYPVGPAKSVDDMVERFRAACQLETDKSFIENTVRGMPEQMKKLIEREGGPTGK
jgi:hypothetical protein